ncbi:MAG: caspase family protein [Candidatus Thermoplasmatota archaeon]|nr:caspase family protein [Candidatus Thermoplasmatota archaeon]
MNGEILSLTIVILMVLGSFGAAGQVSTQHVVNKNSDNILNVESLAGGRKALVVGVADYPPAGPGGPDLQYTDDDARGMREVLKQNGWNENDITIFIDSQGTEGAITNKLNEIAGQTTSSSVSLFFFSGHGTKDGNGEAICCYDSYMYDTELNGILNNFNGRVVVILDTCYSGGMGPPGFNFNADDFITNFLQTLGAGNENRVILMACAANEYSYETDELKSGVFSYFVIEGFRGNADQQGNNDGVITAEETFNYAQPKTTNYMSSQHPQMYDGDPNSEVTIIGGGVSSDITVTVNIYQVIEQDSIEGWPGDDPDWYYTIRMFSKDVAFVTTEIGPENQVTWTPNKNYVVKVIDPVVDIQIKLMEDDLFLDDLADISSHPGGGADNFLFDEWLNGERRGAVYHGAYNLETDTLSGDDFTTESGYYVITGELDGESGDQNDAKILFKITDTYNNDDYKPKLKVYPTSISFGSVGQGETVTATLIIENTAEPDPFNPNRKLDWSITKPSWVDAVNPSSGSLSAGQKKEVVVTVNTGDMQQDDYSGVLKLTSNGGNQDITVSITVPRDISNQMFFVNYLQRPQVSRFLFSSLFFDTSRILNKEVIKL